MLHKKTSSNTLPGKRHVLSLRGNHRTTFTTIILKIGKLFPEMTNGTAQKATNYNVNDLIPIYSVN